MPQVAVEEGPQERRQSDERKVERAEKSRLSAVPQLVPDQANPGRSVHENPGAEADPSHRLED